MPATCPGRSERVQKQPCSVRSCSSRREGRLPRRRLASVHYRGVGLRDPERGAERTVLEPAPRGAERTVLEPAPRGAERTVLEPAPCQRDALRVPLTFSYSKYLFKN